MLALSLVLTAAKCPTAKDQAPSTGVPQPKAQLEQKWVGIGNVGNSCYANTLMHILYFTPGFPEALEEGLKTGFSSPKEANASALYALNEIFKAIGAGNGHKATEAMVMLKERSEPDSDLRQGLCSLPEKWLANFMNGSKAENQIFAGLVDKFFGLETTRKITIENEEPKITTQNSTLQFGFGIEDSSVESLKSVIVRHTRPWIKKYLDDEGKSGEIEDYYVRLQGDNLIIETNVSGDGTEKVKIPLYFELDLTESPTASHAIRYGLELYAMAIHTGSNHFYSVVKTSPHSWHRFDFSVVSDVKPVHEGENGYFEFDGVDTKPHPRQLYYRVKNLSSKAVL